MLSKRMEKERSHFRVDCQKAANRNHAKIRNHRHTIARDVTDRTLFIHFISENEIIYILINFIETRQLGLEPESARKRTNFKQNLPQITCMCSKQISENTSW